MCLAVNQKTRVQIPLEEIKKFCLYKQNLKLYFVFNTVCQKHTRKKLETVKLYSKKKNLLTFCLFFFFFCSVGSKEKKKTNTDSL